MWLSEYIAVSVHRSFASPYLSLSDSHPQIIKELRGGFDARHEQVIPCAGAGDVQQVAFRVVDFFQIRVVGHRLDPFLQGNDLVITGHHSNSAELQAFGKMHGADRNVTVVVSTFSSSTLNGSPAFSTAARARSSSAGERTKTPIS